MPLSRHAVAALLALEQISCGVERLGARFLVAARRTAYRYQYSLVSESDHAPTAGVAEVTPTKRFDPLVRLENGQKVALRHDFQRFTTIEEVVVVFHVNKAVDILRAFKGQPQAGMAVQYNAGSLQLVTIDANGFALPNTANATPCDTKDAANLLSSSLPLI